MLFSKLIVASRSHGLSLSQGPSDRYRHSSFFLTGDPTRPQAAALSEGPTIIGERGQRSFVYVIARNR